MCEKKESAASCFAAIWSFIFHDKKAAGEAGEAFLPLSRCGERGAAY